MFLWHIRTRHPHRMKRKYNLENKVTTKHSLAGNNVSWPTVFWAVYHHLAAVNEI